uniref:Uncharacterized protein n=1 Tax=Angiostrongylus cantonensis TaxID=6313 RepID=A0A0K0D255_ANGCA
MPKFIKRKRLHEIYGQPEDSQQVRGIEMELLRAALRSKRNEMFSRKMKCVTKEQFCALYLEDQLWRRIVGGSILICDSIRSNAKLAFQRKFENMLNNSRVSASRNHRETNFARSQNTVDDAPKKSTVTILGGMTKPESALSVLEFGPSFSPLQPISKTTLRKIACNLYELQDRLRYQAKQRTAKRAENQEAAALPPSPFLRTFFRQQDANEKIDIKFRVFSDGVLKTLNHYRDRRLISNLTAAQKCGLREIRELINSSESS